VDVAMTGAQGYALSEADFHRHYRQHCAEHDGSYVQYRPAYRYGYDLAVHTRYGSGTWVQIELEVRTLWEARNPGTWEQFTSAIQYAWATVSGDEQRSVEPAAGEG
jgi:hypothetical protein